MAFTQTDLPDPVVPATSRWGIAARSAATAFPDTSRPRAKRRGDFEFGEFWTLDGIPQSNQGNFFIGNLHADITLTRHGSLHPDAFGRQGQGQVIRQAGDLADPNPAFLTAHLDEIRLNPKLGDSGSAVDLHDMTGRSEGIQRLFDNRSPVTIKFLVGFDILADIEDLLQRPAAPSSILVRFRQTSGVWQKSWILLLVGVLSQAAGSAGAA